MSYLFNIAIEAPWLLAAFVMSASAAIAIIGQRHRVRGSLAASLKASQSSHISPTPRFGGVAVMIGIVGAVLLGYRDTSPWLFASVLPVFVVGLIEDFGIQTKPALRVTVVSVATCAVIYWTGVSVSQPDTPFLDMFLEYWFASAAFTVFFVVGLTNGINLIDGVNGLASSKVIFSSLALSYVAHQHGDFALYQAGLLIACATFGVFVVNFPMGRIFLGDAGAYTLGFVLAWITILLNERHAEISAWSLLCIISWPIFDTSFSIVRRLNSRNRVAAPDHMHFHQLVMRAWELISRGQIPRTVSNPLATMTMWPLICPTILLGACFSDNNVVGVATFMGSAFAYVTVYLGAMFVLRRRLLRSRIGAAGRAVYDKAIFIIRIATGR